ncbi:MAG TPA: S8 family serine peptidase [Pseudomonadales bacterium]|nr:S8 family serine peptidase [Pseudomonadales bacterium]
MLRNLLFGLMLGAAALAAGAAPGDAPGSLKRVWVVYDDGQRGPAEAALTRANADLHFRMERLNAFVATVPERALAGLARAGGVAYVEDDVKRWPMAEVSPYGIAMVQADQVSDTNAGNRKVCIIDSGIDASHEDLAANVLSGTNDPGTGNWFTDENHHGTHVAGTIAALANGTGVVGVMPNGNIGLHIIKVFGADGWAYSSTLVHALDQCEAAGANVVSMSLGGSFKSRTEDIAFAAANGRGVLSIAAAGNDGNTRKSYPASYDSVVSVAAVDSAKVVADFSQQNDQVELAGPGVSVKSTVPMGTGTEVATVVDSAAFEAIGMDGSATGTGSGALAFCGIGDAPCGAGGAVCLIERGTISFADKVLNCEAGGGSAAIIYNNVGGSLSGTLGGVATTIPSVGVSDVDGAVMIGQLGAPSSVTVESGNYAFYDGTSMATPHVSAVAALVWSNADSCSNTDIRAALDATAEDLGAPGRDTAYGFGLVQAQAASDYLALNGCGGAGGGGGGGGGGQCELLAAGAACTSNDQCCSSNCKGRANAKTCK